jgi:diguanylate cyclase (GGDEF)-like protein
VFGTRSRPPRPLLLVIVLGTFLAIIGITATAQSVLVGAHFSTATLNDVVGSDAATTRAFVNAYLRPADLDPATPPTGPERTRLERQLASLTRAGEIVRLEIRRPDGTIVAASEPGLAGTVVPPRADAAAAVDGTARAAIVSAEAADAAPGSLPAESVVQEFLPIAIDGRVLGVVGIWRDAIPILDRLETVRREVVLVTLTAALAASALLLLIFRSAQGRLTRQTAALVESARRDPLTGALNHGAIVGELAIAVEAARADGRTVGVALIDLDNLTLLNDHHGHAAGDAALLAVADLLEREIDDPLVVGRYGPDEFLVVAPTSAIARLEPAVDRVRTALADLSLRFPESERLPITVSVGIATYPEHAASATALLSVAAQVLEEAKASGGDAIRLAGADGDETAGSTAGFDVLAGLIIAVDTKDRYTKRHSEDVARYAAFLAERLVLPTEDVRTIGLAGMLHDVGKIGIPDQILRKPGKLTDAEYEVVQQHVALGDAIVRDVPDLETVRAGIRHHHERWDGHGYLHRLEGEAIPLIARILAVADAFSAMTTTRPYRKAMDVREALDRLGDAAGTQLDERLVRAFIDGIEHADAPPLPGMDGPALVAGTPLWLPGRRVA